MAKRADTSMLSAEERAAVEARREYQRQWRAANRDRIRVHNQRYWNKKAKELMNQRETTTKKKPPDVRQHAKRQEQSNPTRPIVD